MHADSRPKVINGEELDMFAVLEGTEEGLANTFDALYVVGGEIETPTEDLRGKV